MKTKKFLAVLTSLTLAFSFSVTAGCSSTEEKSMAADYEYTRNNLYAIDALGRTFAPVGNMNDEKSVGIFYMLWAGQHGITAKPYDITTLLKENEAALWSAADGNADSPMNSLHWWGEPLYGYYNQQDEWVVRRHMEMLMLAGIDYLGLDCTNIETYDAAWLVAFEVLQEMADQGLDIPKLVFYTNTSASGASWPKVVHFYEMIYSTGRYRDVWYCPNGKPVIITTKVELERERPDLMEFFDVRASQWPGAAPQDTGVPWMSFQRPQEIIGDATSVSVAQQLRRFSEAYSSPLNTGYRKNASWGRGYTTAGGFNYDENASLSGANFQEEWDYAITNKNVNHVFVTSWNEWVAQKFLTEGYISFTDCFNQEYSRDVEPMKGGHGDNFLIQLASNVRRFKESEQAKKANVNREKITINDLSSWEDVPAYMDPRGDACERNHIGAWQHIYTDKTNRNDIVSVKIANDDNFLYVNAEVAYELIVSDDENWMNVYLRNVDSKEEGLAGYHYVLNRSRNLAQGYAKLQSVASDGTLEDVVDCVTYVGEKNVVFRIPLTALGVSANAPRLAVKVTDNIQNFTDAMDFYVSGDSAPLGRFSYGYGM